MTGRIGRWTCAAALVVLTGAPVEAQTFTERWRARVQQFERENARLEADGKYVVLFGSSSMEGWKSGRRVERFLPTVGPRALNRGISGDGIGLPGYPGGLKNRMQASVYDCKPSHVFLLNGTNSIGRTGTHVEATARAYREVITLIQGRLPGVVVCVVTVQPSNHGYAVMAPHLVRFNTRIKEIAAELGCPVIDLHALLVAPDGLHLPRDLTSDGLHFNDKGYAILGREIERVVAETTRTADAGLPLPDPRDPTGALAGGPGTTGTPGGASGGASSGATPGAPGTGGASGGTSGTTTGGITGALGGATGGAAPEPPVPPSFWERFFQSWRWFTFRF